MSIALLSSLFLLLCLVMAAAVVGLFARYLAGRARVMAIAVFVLWLLYAGVLGAKGIIASRVPPGPLLLLIPSVAFIAAFVTRRSGVKKFASEVPATLLIGLQVFRVFVEIALYELCLKGLVPRMLTFEGANFDILTGLSAPLVAWLYASRRISDRAVRAWSWAGIALLANVLIRALLTFSGVLRTEVPNVGIGIFPFTFLPGLLVPLALILHILLLRSLPRTAALRSALPAGSTGGLVVTPAK